MAIHEKIDGLTKLQNSFVDCFCKIYAKTGKENWRQAMLDAGYSIKSISSTMHQIKENPVIIKAIKERMKEAAKECNITVEYILANLIQVYERAMQITPVKDRQGNLLGTFTFDGRTANRSMELLAKISGLYKETVINKNEDFEDAMKKLFAKAREDADKKSKKYSAEKDPEILAKATKLAESKIVRVKEEEVFSEEKKEKVPSVFDDNDDMAIDFSTFKEDNED